MSFLTIAISSALLLSTPILIADRSELVADSNGSSNATSALTSGQKITRPVRHVVDGSNSRSSTPVAPVHKDEVQVVEAEQEAELTPLSESAKRTDSAISVSGGSPWAPLLRSPVDAADIDVVAAPSADDEGIDDSPLTFKAAAVAALLPGAHMSLPFRTTLMDFAMDKPAIKHEHLHDGEQAELVQSREPIHIGIGFPFGI
ncbi:hypothetical protein BC828DRAFT_385931 [Blastocladiella britannica]|nr:hypothetical protein BC828DRAFT_385931 [Blastocladiella britannica]